MNDLSFQDTKLILSLELIEKLNASPGDKIDISFIDIDEVLYPAVSKSDNGNKLNKTNSIVFKGKKNQLLKSLGTEFTIDEEKSTEDLIILKGENPTVFTSVEAAVSHLNNFVFEDNNYNIKELEYEF